MLFIVNDGGLSKMLGNSFRVLPAAAFAVLVRAAAVANGTYFVARSSSFLVIGWKSAFFWIIGCLLYGDEAAKSRPTWSER